MSDDRTIIYTFKMQTNISEVAEEVKSNTDKTKQALEETTQKQDSLKKATEGTTEALTKQQGQLMAQITTLMAVKSAVSGVTGGLIQMGLVSGENAQKLQTVNSALNLVAGMATGIKALALAQETFNLSSLKTAVISTYNSIMENPAKLAMVGLGIGAATGVVAALMMNGSGGGSSSNTTNNIYIEDSAGKQVQTANAINVTISGGKVL